MAILHVAVTGRDRRHLSELRNKFRVIVVGVQETRRGLIVDAYIPAERADWLRKKGYGVELLQEVEGPSRARQAEGRAAAESRLKRGRYGDVIWGGGYLTVDEVEAAMVLARRTTPGYLSASRFPIVPGRSAGATLFASVQTTARTGRRSAFLPGCMDANGAARTF